MAKEQTQIKSINMNTHNTKFDKIILKFILYLKLNPN